MPMPSAADIAKLTAKSFRSTARRQRRRNQLVGGVIALVVLGVVAGGGYAGYRYFEQQDGTQTQPGGLQGVLGDAIDSVEGLDRYDPSLAAGFEGALTLPQVTPSDVLPIFALGVARDLGAADGLQRYAVAVEDLADLQPSLTTAWLTTLAKLPQGPVGEGVLPPAGAGELTIGIAQDGDRVLRLVVRSAEPPLSIDTTG